MQIIAKKIEVQGTNIIANGNVLIFSPNYYVSAKKIIYNKQNKTLELFGNVNISKNNEAVSVSNHAFIDMKNEIKTASPVLLIDKKSDVWIDANDITKKSDTHIIKDATLSSCDCINPAWSIGFKSGDFNTTDEWINLYNNTLYIKDIPAWYFLIPLAPYLSTQNLIMSYLLVNPPYAGFSTNTKRRSGLLRPKVGFSKSQGYLYEQSIFYAPALNYDFEYIPKIRSKRGYGHELIYRYKDSINSQLEMSAGKFFEYDDYYTDENLINKEHYGWNVDYVRNSIFSSNNSSDGLNINLQNMNDIEYKNTKYNEETISSDKIIKSQITYFYNTNNYYFDAKFQKYHDIYTGDDSLVFQTLPQIKLHKYSNLLFGLDNISASFNYEFNNKTRSKNIGANISDIIVPINYSQYFLNDFLNLSFTEQLKFRYYDYKNTLNYDKAYNLTNQHILNFSTDLLKSYTNIIHTININTTFTKINTIKQSEDLYGINSNDSELNPFVNTKSLDSISLSLNQNFYSKKTLKNIVNHRINQSILNDNGTSTLGNLENELSFYFDNGSILNRTLYNHDDKKIVKSTFAFKYKKDDFFINADYSYSIDKNIITQSYDNQVANKSIVAQIGNKVLKYYTVKYKEQYNITNDITKLREYSLNIDRKCWTLDLKLSDALVASATTNQKARRQNIVYVTLTLKPLITLKQKYIQDEREE